MKLLTNVHDYYDSAIQYSTDVVFRRLMEVRTLYREEKDAIKKSLACSLNGCIGFCGTIYPVYVHDSHIYYPQIPSDMRNLLCQLKEIQSYNAQYDPSWMLRELLQHSGLMETPDIKGGRRFTKAQPQHTYEPWADHELFLELKKPYFFVYANPDLHTFPWGTPEIMCDTEGRYLPHRILVLNPTLKSLEFNKILDPFTAAQEIEMYLGRIATNDTPVMPVGSDKVIAASKGFDSPYSFRKRPTKKTNHE